MTQEPVVTYTTASVNAAASEPRFHCFQDGGRVTIAFSERCTTHAVYLDGTPTELRDFVGRLRDAVLDVIADLGLPGAKVDV